MYMKPRPKAEVHVHRKAWTTGRVVQVYRKPRPQAERYTCIGRPGLQAERYRCIGRPRPQAEVQVHWKA